MSFNKKQKRKPFYCKKAVHSRNAVKARVRQFLKMKYSQIVGVQVHKKHITKT